MQRFLTIVSAGVLLAAPALGYPGGTPGFQTDVAPYCAGCHSSRTEEMLAGSGPRAQKELPGAKHYPKISAGKGGYEALSDSDRATLIEHLKALEARYPGLDRVSIRSPSKPRKINSFKTRRYL